MPLKKWKKYCSMCSNFRGKMVEGKVVSLHRFPANDRIRKVWIQRCKLSMKTFRYTENSKLCYEHFEERCGPTMMNPLPTVFGKKRYKTSVSLTLILFKRRSPCISFIYFSPKWRSFPYGEIAVP